MVINAQTKFFEVVSQGYNMTLSQRWDSHGYLSTLGNMLSQCLNKSTHKLVTTF
jgi:hypothetical protein